MDNLLDGKQLKIDSVPLEKLLTATGQGTVTIGTGSAIAMEKDPTSDFELANKLYVDNQISVSAYTESTDYYSNNFITDTNSYTQTMGDLDFILGLIAPAKPETLTGKIFTSSATVYSAKISNGNTTDWYPTVPSVVNAGDTISTYTVASSY